jgi:kynurenine formamidase
VAPGLTAPKLYDLSQDFSMHTPGFAGFASPTVRWIKRIAFDRAGGQELTTTLHIGTHLDSPAHWVSGGIFIGDLPLDWLVGPACVVDLERMGLGDYDVFGAGHLDRWERDTGITVERDDILIVHTGYHRYYPDNWVDRAEPDETRYFCRHPGPTADVAEWVLERGVRWLAFDSGSADHPMNTPIRRIRPDEAAKAEAKLGRSLDEVFPPDDYQVMHTRLFPHGIVHIENLGGEIDSVLDRRVLFGAFPWRFQGGEAAFCRAVVFGE